MNCKNCNERLPEKSNFCPNCGTKIIKEPKSNKKVSKNTQNINPLYIIIIAGLLAIFAVVLILDSNVPEQRVVQNNTIPNQESSELFSKITALNNQLSKDPDNIGLNIELGNNLFDAKQYQKAIPHYRKALYLSPNNVEVRIDLAVSYYNLQVIDTALVEINKALELNPHHQQGLYNLGVMHYNSGNKEKAKESWEKLIQLHEGTQTAETAKQLLKNI